MSNTNWLFGVEMSMLNYHTGPVRTVEPLCTVFDYISNFEGVDCLDAARFAEIEDGDSGV